MMENSDPFEFVSFNYSVLDTWAVWPIGPKCPYIYWIRAFVVHFLIIFTVTGQIYYIFFITKDVIALAEALTFAFTAACMVCKSLNVLVQRKKFAELLEFMCCDMFKPKTEKHSRVIIAWITVARRTSKIYLFITIFTLISAFIYTLITKSRKHFCAVKYPYWDVEESPASEIVYLCQVLSCSAICSVNSCMDTLVAAFMSQAIAQLECMNISLEELIDDEEQNTPLHPRDEDIILENFKNIVVHHRTILDYVSKMEDMFGVPIIFQYMSSGLIICCNCIILFVMNPKNDYLKVMAMFSYTATMLWEIFMLCWFGNEIMIKSDNSTRSIYNTNWNRASTKFRKLMIILMERVKKPIVMTVFKMVKLNLASFVTILNSAYSFYAVLHHMYTVKIMNQN